MIVGIIYCIVRYIKNFAYDIFDFRVLLIQLILLLICFSIAVGILINAHTIWNNYNRKVALKLLMNDLNKYVHNQFMSAKYFHIFKLIGWIALITMTIGIIIGIPLYTFIYCADESKRDISNTLAKFSNNTTNTGYTKLYRK